MSSSKVSDLTAITDLAGTDEFYVVDDATGIPTSRKIAASDVRSYITGFTSNAFNVARYGATGDGTTDDTDAIRDAFAAAKTAGGGTVFFPSGTYISSLSGNSNYCYEIPANTHVMGESAGNTIITFPESETSTSQILMVNEDADTASSYGAAGNIVISDLTLRMTSTAESTRSNGDVIALGHAKNVIVRDCFFGKHSQHAVDIAGCQDVQVINCRVENSNGATGAAANAAVQVDRAVAGAFLGINADNTVCDNILIKGNTFRVTNTNEILHIGHNGGTHTNIRVIGNHLYGTARSFSEGIRCDVDSTSLDGLVIAGNTIELTTANNAGIALVCNGNNSETLKNIQITGNIIRGTGGTGIYVGGTSSFTQSTFPDFFNISITGNTIDLDWNSSTNEQRGIIVSLCENVTVEGNAINVTKASDNNNMYGIFFVSCLSAVARGNTVKTALTTSYTGTNISAAIALSRYGSILTTTTFTMEASSNYVDISAFRYGLAATGMDSLAIDRPRFSGNTFIGSLTNGDYHIYETLPASDGTNGVMDVDFGSGTYTQAVATDTSYSVSPGLTKASASNAVTSPSFFGLTYTSGGTSTVATDQELLISNAANIGLQIQNYDATAGTFDIVTGSTGVNVTINQGGADSTRTTGTIRCRFGI